MSFSKDIGRLRAYKGLIAHLSPGLQVGVAIVIRQIPSVIPLLLAFEIPEIA